MPEEFFVDLAPKHTPNQPHLLFYSSEEPCIVISAHASRITQCVEEQSESTIPSRQ